MAAGNVRHLAVGAGKDGHIYVVNRDAMGKFNAGSNNIYQDLTGVLGGGVFSMPAYFNGHALLRRGGRRHQGVQDHQRAIRSGPAFQTSNTFPYPGATPSISASGTSNAIVWAAENASPAVLHAYDASNLHELYNSNQASGGRDQFGPATSSSRPWSQTAKYLWGRRTAWECLGCCRI